MFNYTNHLIPEERQAWKSAYEIQIAALKHEEQRIQMMQEETSSAAPQAQARKEQKSGFLTLLMAPLRMLSALIG